jgi:hypothetical protein
MRYRISYFAIKNGHPASVTKYETRSVGVTPGEPTKTKWKWNIFEKYHIYFHIFTSISAKDK